VDRLARLKKRNRHIDDILQDSCRAVNERQTSLTNREIFKTNSEIFQREHVALFHLQQTNAKLLTYYEIRKQASTGQHDDLIHFDIDLPGRVGMLDGKNDD